MGSLSSKSCYQLLLDLNPPRPHCVEKCLPRFRPWDWHCTWWSLHVMPLDRQVIDLKWKIATGFYILLRILPPSDTLFKWHVSVVPNLKTWSTCSFPARSPKAVLPGSNHFYFFIHPVVLLWLPVELRSAPKIFTYLLNVCKYFVWLQRNDHRFLRQWAAGGLFGSFNDSTFVVSFPYFLFCFLT